MASNPTATLTSLLRNSTIDDHEEMLKAANAALKSSKGDSDALHTRVVALLKLDRFDDALRALDDGGDRLAVKCDLERSYALYKTGKLGEAEEISQASEKRGSKHVAAQVAYRAEKFEDAARIYKELSAQRASIDGEENDLRINSLAIEAQLSWQGKDDRSYIETSREDLEAFETCYNAACSRIARGNYKGGNILLQRARYLCEGLDELSDEEKRAEVLPIMVQQAYGFTKLGKVEEAALIQKMINISDVPEPQSRVVAQNNAFASATDVENPYLIPRIFDEKAPTLTHTEKHFKHQESILRRNSYAMDLQSQKYPGVARSTLKILLKNPSPTLSPFVNTIAVVNAAAHARNEMGKAAIKAISPLVERRPSDIGLVLSLVQLYIQSSNPGPAIDLLEALFGRLEALGTTESLSIRYSPGLVATAVSLYKLSGRTPSKRAEMANAAKYWQDKSKAPASLLRAAGMSLLGSTSSEDHSVAGELFSSLRKQDSSDRIAIAGYVAAYATTDLRKVSADLESLTPVSKLISGIDASALEEAGIPTLQIPSSQTSKKRDAEQAAQKAGPVKKHKIRESRKPEDFDENKVMDPERWLPLRDRSSYRPKGKKGKKKAMDLTQGGVVKEEESLELAGGAGSVKVEKAGVLSGGNKKNKKRGKK